MERSTVIRVLVLIAAVLCKRGFSRRATCDSANLATTSTRKAPEHPIPTQNHPPLPPLVLPLSLQEINSKNRRIPTRMPNPPLAAKRAISLLRENRKKEEIETNIAQLTKTIIVVQLATRKCQDRWSKTKANATTQLATREINRVLRAVLEESTRVGDARAQSRAVPRSRH